MGENTINEMLKNIDNRIFDNIENEKDDEKYYTNNIYNY